MRFRLSSIRVSGCAPCSFRLAITVWHLCLLTATAAAGPIIPANETDPEPDTTFRFESYAHVITRLDVFDSVTREMVIKEAGKVANAVGTADFGALAKPIISLADPKASASAYASAHGRFDYVNGGTKLHLGLDFIGSATGTAAAGNSLASTGMADALLQISYFDRTTFTGNGTLPILGSPEDPTFVTLNFSIDGTVHLDAVDQTALGLFFEARSGGYSSNFGYSRSRSHYDDPPTFQESVSAQLQVTAILGPDRSIPWSISGGMAGTAWNGTINAIFGKNTITLESIKFADGSTPEERGFTLVFDSGLTSPNLLGEAPAAQSVPEPSTLAVFGIGWLGLGIVKQRKRRPRGSRRNAVEFAAARH